MSGAVSRSGNKKGYLINLILFAGQWINHALPFILARGTGPQKRESHDWSLLSPMAKYEPSGTVTGPKWSLSIGP
ncbi:hypothetical protein Dip518_000971 [Parelusimicrobium proximum]